MITRSKFYVTNNNCSSYNQHLENGPTYAEIILNPVYSQNPESENYKFWTSSPSGKMNLRIDGDKAGEYPAGSFWYVDVEAIAQDAPDTEDVFTLVKNEKPIGDWANLTVQLSRSNGTYLEIGISNQDVWPMFMNKIGDRFSVTMFKTTKDG